MAAARRDGSCRVVTGRWCASRWHASNVCNRQSSYTGRMMCSVLLRDLDWLVTLAEVGHVTDAAATLQTNQPTLSRALARLEDDLGVRIFERVPTGVVLTPDGE